MTAQPDIASLTSPFIALKSERREESFYTICEVTGRRDGVIELLVKNGSYPADLTISDGVYQLTVTPRGGDERFAGYPPWPSSLEWHGTFPKGIVDLEGMQEYLVQEFAENEDGATAEPAELEAAI